MKKLIAIVFIPGIIMAITFIALGDAFEAALSHEQFIAEYGTGSWPWLVAISFLISDLLLPIPASGIMAAIGSLYGLNLGFIINFTGTMSAGILAYGLARMFGTKASRFICSQDEIKEYKIFFDKWGGTSIIASRLLPIMPEALALAAGFSGMSFKKFVLALTLGSLLVTSIYTWIGSTSKAIPSWGISISVVIPLLLWLILSRFIRNNPTE